MRKSCSKTVLIFTSFFLFSTLGIAEPPAGRLLASHCAQCHGTNGNAISRMDSLAGKNADYLYKELLELKYSTPPYEIMDHQAKGYTDHQLWLIARYFSTLPPKMGMHPHR